MSNSFLFWRPEAPLSEADRVPVTLLSGFLGSGKTTLLNHLLASEAIENLAVLVNDLGKVNIDASLIKSSMREMGGPIGEVVELSSGCICCSIQTELMDALLHLISKQSRVTFWLRPVVRRSRNRSSRVSMPRILVVFEA